MRWPFSRRGNETAPPARAAEPSRDLPEPVQRRAEWATLPPIQRAAAAPIELTAESGLFVEHLATHAAFETALQPLGHNVTMEAPAGIATGIARPVEHVGGGPELQHRVHPAPRPTAAARANPFASPLPSIAPQTVARMESPAPASPTPTAPSSPPPPEPARESPSVQRAAEAPVVPGTPPAPAADPPPLVLRTPAPSAAPETPAPVARHEAPAESPPTVVAAPLAETATPVQRAADEAVGPGDVEIAPAPAEQAATVPAEEISRAEEEEEAATAVAPTPEGGAQRAAEESPAPTVGARPVVAAQGFRSSLGPLPAKVGLERTDPLTYAAQRAPAGGAAAPAAAPSIAASAPGVVQRSAEDTAAPPAPGSPVPPAPAQRAADAPVAAPTPSPSPLQRSPETAAPSAPSIPTAPPVGERPVLGLGAPLKPQEAQPRSTPAAPQPTPQPAGPTTFRRTRSSLSAQRAAEGTPSPLARQPSPAPAPEPAAPSIEPQTPSAAVQRALAESPAQPLPPARAPFPPGVQRAPVDAPESFDVGVQRAEEAPSAVAPLTGLDAFIARVADLSAAESSDAPEPVQRAAEDGGPAPLLITEPTGRLAPRLELPRPRRASTPGTPAPASGSLAVQRAPETPPQALPVVGRRPLRLQRSADDVPAPVRAHVESQTATTLGGREGAPQPRVGERRPAAQGEGIHDRRRDPHAGRSRAARPGARTLARRARARPRRAAAAARREPPVRGLAPRARAREPGAAGRGVDGPERLAARARAQARSGNDRRDRRNDRRPAGRGRERLRLRVAAGPRRRPEAPSSGLSRSTS